MTKPPASAARSVPESIAATLASEIAAEHLKPGERLTEMKLAIRTRCAALAGTTQFD